MLYKEYSKSLADKYGEKVYKLPINLDVTCPNRDGNIGLGGCAYCGSCGAGYESLSSTLSAKEQLKLNMDYIGPKYNAKKFIAYFQNFSNTYMPPKDFREAVMQARMENIVGIDVSTRPDCIASEYLDILKETGLDICIELGLQTVNYHTLKSINRGHSLAEFIDAVLTVKSYGFEVCAHVILDFPQDDTEDIIECAKILSALKIDTVKLHSLYIVKGTEFEKMYDRGSLKLLSAEDYVNRCTAFLRHLSPDISVARIIGRAPEKDTRIANFGMSWWKIKDMICGKMEAENIRQGDMYTYLGGSAVKKFLQNKE